MRVFVDQKADCRQILFEPCPEELVELCAGSLFGRSEDVGLLYRGG